MSVPPFAIFGSLALSELVLIIAVALMVFGGRLPEVAMRAVAQIMRARKVVTKMWREPVLDEHTLPERREETRADPPGA